MLEDDLETLVDGTVRYFAAEVDGSAAVGTPYLLVDREQPVLSDYTGVIGVSGSRSGCIYFTAPSAMLRHILLRHGENAIDTGFMKDVVGEVANVISGNARRTFGDRFVISVPSVYAGRPQQDQLGLAERAFVIPIAWRHYQAALVVSIA
jgi:chemotaxis protein CheX